MTERLVHYIERKALERTFTSLADELGINETTIRRVFRKYADREMTALQFSTPKWMGLDELYLIRQYRGVVTNVRERTIVELLPNRNQKSVANYISSIKDRSHIELVTIDMWIPYRNVLRELLPHAQIVVDKFHVVRMANQALERVRKATRERLTVRQRLRLKNDRFLLLTNRENLSSDRLLLSGKLDCQLPSTWSSLQR